jgi:hypothetical protein
LLIATLKAVQIRTEAATGRQHNLYFHFNSVLISAEIKDKQGAKVLKLIAFPTVYNVFST